MKIITPTRVSDDTTHLTTICGSCGCVFEFQRNEASLWSTAPGGKLHRIDCPGCGKKVWVQL